VNEPTTAGARFDGFKKTAVDTNIDGAIAEHCRRFGIDPLEAVKLFPVLARRQWLKRFLAHTELFRRTLDVPGDIAELGVYRGLGLLTWANLLESFAIGDRTKVVYGFDNWTGFRALSPQDGSENADAHKVVGGFDPGDFRAELDAAIEIFDADRFIPWKPRTSLIDGDIEQSVPDFLDRHPGVRFSLVHFDCDLYAPTKAALEALWPRVSRGGLVLFDEYAIADWPGETQAVDEFIATRPELRVQTLPWTNAPAGFIVKP
jgi:hypothetical protein